MKRSPSWVAALGIIVQMAALGLCAWVMESEKNKGRQLTGGTAPAAPPPPAPPPFGDTPSAP